MIRWVSFGPRGGRLSCSSGTANATFSTDPPRAGMAVDERRTDVPLRGTRRNDARLHRAQASTSHLLEIACFSTPRLGRYAGGQANSLPGSISTFLIGSRNLSESCPYNQLVTPLSGDFDLPLHV